MEGLVGVRKGNLGQKEAGTGAELILEHYTSKN